MKTRIVFGAALFPIVVAFLIWGGLALRVALLGVSLVALKELYRAIFSAQKGHGTVQCLGYGSVVLYFAFLEIAVAHFFIILIAWILINLIYMVFNFKKVHIGQCLSYIVLPIYTAVFLSTVYIIRDADAIIVWVIFLASWGSDTFCYFSGKAFGKHKLVKELSPSKTIEGSFGGVVCTALLGMCFAQFFQINLGPYGINPVLMYGGIFAAIAIFSQLGDLVASGIKRQTGIKDFGKLIPGHGGAMDRFDSVILTAPIFYVFLSLIGYV